MLELRQLIQKLRPDRHGDLRSRGRSWRATVCRKVDQRRVGLMPDGGDQRDRRIGGGADHFFLVERPQILDRAAAARDDQQVGTRLDRARNRGSPSAILRRRALALDRRPARR